MAAGPNNLLHVLSNVPCTDPDCELHNPEVGRAEETVSLTDLAFYFAGAKMLANLVLNAQPEGELDVEDYVQAAVDIALAELRDQHLVV
jgi:hypothetical protein